MALKSEQVKKHMRHGNQEFSIGLLFFENKLRYLERKPHQLVFMRVLYPGRIRFWSVGFGAFLWRQENPQKNLWKYGQNQQT